MTRNRFTAMCKKLAPLFSTRHTPLAISVCIVAFLDDDVPFAGDPAGPVIACMNNFVLGETWPIDLRSVSRREASYISGAVVVNRWRVNFKNLGCGRGA